MTSAMMTDVLPPSLSSSGSCSVCDEREVVTLSDMGLHVFTAVFGWSLGKVPGRAAISPAFVLPIRRGFNASLEVLMQV